MSAMDNVRSSPIAGTWYSKDAVRLSRQLDDFLSQVPRKDIRGRVVGLVVPHAGYQYSGLTAAHGFSTVSGSRRSVVVIFSPFHDYHPAALISSGHSCYQTPLGRVCVDLELLARFEANLKADTGLEIVRVVNDREHSLEIELPFLQRTLDGDFRLLPLMIRTHQLADLQQIGRVLAPLLDAENCLLVASTDLSHFYPEQTAERLDHEMLRRIALFSPEEVLQAEEQGLGFACGVGAVAAMLVTARHLGADAVELLHYSTSGAVTGDLSQVVGYGSAVVTRRA